MYLYHVATAVVVFCYSLYHFFFVKQKTAYEMRISDWSSDVCSSDLDGSDNKTGKGASAPFLLARTDEYGAPAAGSERLRTFDPPPQGEGDHPSGGGGAQAVYAVLDLMGRISGNGARARYLIGKANRLRSEEHTSELQSLMRISYAVFCLKKKNK